MKQTHKCFICGVEGLVADNEIRVSETDDPEFGPLLVAQCPLCNRFICAKHGERLPGEKRSFFLSRSPKTFVIGCPFDAGITLGGSGILQYQDILNKLLDN